MIALVFFGDDVRTDGRVAMEVLQHMSATRLPINDALILLVGLLAEVNIHSARQGRLTARALFTSGVFVS